MRLLLVLGGLPQGHDSTVTGSSCSRQETQSGLRRHLSSSSEPRTNADCRHRHLHFATATAKAKGCSPFVWERRPAGEQRDQEKKTGHDPEEEQFII